MPSIVNKNDIIKACNELGLKSNDTIIIHSSLKSFGYVDGGAEAVIAAFKEVLSDGTLCFPALRQKNFGNSYVDWDIKNTPSDVGFLSETFRKMDGVLRSDQETHSVTAIGVNAEFVTSGHRGGKPRVCLYGEHAFSYTSPWQRICDLGGKVVFIGVPLKVNTMKHLVESTVVTDILDSITDEAERAEAYAEVSNCFAPPELRKPTNPDGTPGGFWLWYDGEKMQEFFEEKGLIKSVYCGDSKIMCIEAEVFRKEWYNQLRYYPEKWLRGEDRVAFMKKYDKGNK